MCPVWTLAYPRLAPWAAFFRRFAAGLFLVAHCRDTITFKPFATRFA